MKSFVHNERHFVANSLKLGEKKIMHWRRKTNECVFKTQRNILGSHSEEAEKVKIGKLALSMGFEFSKKKKWATVQKSSHEVFAINV